MRDWYDNPRLEDIFDEQAAKLPNGPLGLLEPPEVKLVEGFSPKELELIRALKIKKIGALNSSLYGRTWKSSRTSLFRCSH